MFKARFSTRPCVIAHRNDQLLIAAGIKKKDFKWLNHFGVTNGYTTALKKNKALAVGFDKQLLEWKNEVETQFKAEELQDNLIDLVINNTDRCLVDLLDDKKIVQSLTEVTTNFDEKLFQDSVKKIKNLLLIDTSDASAITEVFQSYTEKEITEYQVCIIL